MRSSYRTAVTKYVVIGVALAAALTLAKPSARADDGPAGAVSPLSRFVGAWEGRSEDARFREITRYRWGPGGSHLLVDMTFYADGAETGTGSGFMVWDGERDGLVFHVVTSQGAAIRQEQTAGDATRMELAATATNGATVGFPPSFRTHIEFTGDDAYESGVWLETADGGWQQVMRNRFERTRD